MASREKGIQVLSEIVRYEAQDGCEVELTPARIINEILPQKYRNSVDARGAAVLIAKLSARRMNPLSGDCTIGVFKGVPTIMPSIGYYRRVAASVDTFDGVEKGVIVQTSDGRLHELEGSFYTPEGSVLVGGWCKAYDKSRSRPVVAKVSMAEYDQRNGMWESKPGTMIQKVAESQALRELYPGKFDGTYTREELPAEDPRAEVAVQAEPEIEVPDFGFGDKQDKQDEEDVEDAPEEGAED